jgi:hypothetical protein
MAVRERELIQVALSEQARLILARTGAARAEIALSISSLRSTKSSKTKTSRTRKKSKTKKKGTTP